MGWLAWQLIASDRAVAARRTQERLEPVVVTVLARSLADEFSASVQAAGYRVETLLQSESTFVLADRDLTRLVAPQYVSDCQPSPDGQWIGFVRLDQTKPTSTELCLVPAAGGDARVVHTFNGMIRAVAWSPDSRQVFFVGTPNGAESAGLWRASIDTGATTRIEGFDRPVLQSGQFRIHPDGRRIAFSAGEPKSEFWVLWTFSRQWPLRSVRRASRTKCPPRVFRPVGVRHGGRRRPGLQVSCLDGGRGLSPAGRQTETWERRRTSWLQAW